MKARIKKFFKMTEETNNKEMPVSEEPTADSNSETITSKESGETAELKNTELPQEDNSAIALLEEQIAELNDKHIRLLSEFDNYRKRTAKERSELVKTAGEDIFKALLPIIDDFERGLSAMESATDVESLKDGVKLIYNKLNNTLSSKGLEPLNSIGSAFDFDLHEAVTYVSAPNEDMKGKVVDELEKGYMLNGKVIRFAKVVIGN